MKDRGLDFTKLDNKYYEEMKFILDKYGYKFNMKDF